MRTKFHESVARSVSKSVLYRVITIISDFIIIYFLTHQYIITVGVVVFTNIASTGEYYLHERLWNMVHWGKHKSKN